MTPRRIALAALLAAMTLAACGVKGDPVRPGAEPAPRKAAEESQG